jgi:hypothetical protein
MFHRWAALVLVLALCAMTPKIAAGQTTSKAPRGHGAGSLGRNFPNPINPNTTVPFTVGDTTNGCADDRDQHVVSMQIVNILSQQVAIPILLGTATSTSTAVSGPFSGQYLSKVQLPCGSYNAFWNGNIQNTIKEAASGVYIVLLSVDGRPAGSRRIFVSK